MHSKRLSEPVDNGGSQSFPGTVADGSSAQKVHRGSRRARRGDIESGKFRRDLPPPNFTRGSGDVAPRNLPIRRRCSRIHWLCGLSQCKDDDVYRGNIL